MKFWPILFILQQFIITTVALGLDLGLTPTYYKKGEKVDLLVNKVESDHTQLPYGYYDLKFVCPPSKNSKPLHLSLGEIFRGDRLWESDYKLRFGVDTPCVRLCDFNAKEAQLRFADSLIKNGYVVHWSVDGLPGATTFVSNNRNNKYYAAGFPLGFFKDDISYLYNHVMLVIRYHSEKSHPGLHTIVGFEVYPKSVIDETCPGSSKSYKNLAINLKKDRSGQIPKQRIPFTYSVYWREDNSIDYNNRWGLYYENESNASNSHIHWMSLINSFVLLSLVSLVMAIIFFRVIKADPKLPVSNTDAEPPSSPTLTNNEISWKNLSGEVTKKPNYSLFLSVLVASGIQMIFAIVGVILSIVIKSLFEMNKTKGSRFNNYQGAFSSFALSCFVFSGVIPSFFGIIIYKIFNNDYLNSQYPTSKNIKISILFSGFLPTLMLSFVLFFNFFVWAKESSHALPFGTIIVLLLLFFVVVLPLGLIGGYYGNRTKFNKKSFLLYSSESKSSTDDQEIKHRFKPNKNSGLMSFNTLFVMMMYGLIPFGIVYVELSFIFNSIWLEKTTFYYMYGFLFLTTIILLITVAESSVIATYLTLTINHNPKWQWLCFRVGASVGLYIYAYTFYYFFTHLHVRDFVSILLYFAYMGLVSLLIGIACGSVAVIAGLAFIKKVYGTVKVD